MPFSRFRSPEWVGLLFAFGVLLSSYLTYLAYRDAANWVEYTVRVRREITNLSRDCIRAETGQRGFLLTGQEEYLGDYYTGVTEANARMNVLDVLVRDNPAQASRLAAIRLDVVDKFAELGETIKKVKDGDKPGAYTVVNSNRGRRSMIRIEAGLDAMTVEEDRILEEKAGKSEFLFRVMLTEAIGVGVILGLALLFALRSWRRNRVV